MTLCLSSGLTSPRTQGTVINAKGLWTSVDNHLPRINPLTCKDGEYSTIHSTYYHCYLI
jgi:hypothetical protein